MATERARVPGHGSKAVRSPSANCQQKARWTSSRWKIAYFFFFFVRSVSVVDTLQEEKFYYLFFALSFLQIVYEAWATTLWLDDVVRNYFLAWLYKSTKARGRDREIEICTKLHSAVTSRFPLSFTRREIYTLLDKNMHALRKYKLQRSKWKRFCKCRVGRTSYSIILARQYGPSRVRNS